RAQGSGTGGSRPFLFFGPIRNLVPNRRLVEGIRGSPVGLAFLFLFLQEIQPLQVGPQGLSKQSGSVCPQLLCCPVNRSKKLLIQDDLNRFHGCGSYSTLESTVDPAMSVWGTCSIAAKMKGLKRFIYRNWQGVHGVRRMELSVLTRYLELGNPKRILDVGSGKGAFAGKLSRAGHDVVGVDPSAKAAGIARRFVDSKGKVVLGQGEAQPVSSGSFDRAVSVCVLEHTRDDSAVLAEVHRVLRPGGIFALTVDCLDSPHVPEAFRRHYAKEYRCNQFY